MKRALFILLTIGICGGLLWYFGSMLCHVFFSTTMSSAVWLAAVFCLSAVIVAALVLGLVILHVLIPGKPGKLDQHMRQR